MTDHIYTVNLPDIGEGVAEGEVIEWLKAVNDPVKQDEPIVVVMTDKVTVELPAPYPGTLSKQYHNPGELAKKGKPIYDLLVSDQVPAHPGKKSAPPKAKESTPCQPASTPVEQFQAALAEVVPQRAQNAPKPTSNSTNRATAAPKVRQMAKELGIDINQIEGTSPEGHVTIEDIQRFIQSPQAASPQPSRTSKKAGPIITQSTPVMHLEDDEVRPIIGLRNLISEKMVEAKYIVPHFSFFDQLDATRLIQLRENLKPHAAEIGIKLTYMPFFIKALSMSLLKYPDLNGSVDLATNQLIIHKQHHIGIAVQLPTGLMVVVLKNVERMSLFDLIKAYERLKIKAQEGKLEVTDMRDSTITISNFGVLGGMWATPIINYPEIAILGVARICKQPTIREGIVVARDILNLSWSFDHRVIDGEAASQFSNHYISLLENPAQML
jgi:pyruvate dehydrogenase E2 component (dihydrolipoamide acetyltransferase)